MFVLRDITTKNDVKYEEQICSQLSTVSPCQISLHYDNVNKLLKIEFQRGDWNRPLAVCRTENVQIFVSRAYIFSLK